MLERDRKPYQDTPALYFISERSSSIQKLLKDFEQEEPQYEQVHLCFPGQVGSKNMDLLSKNEALVERIQTFLELNLNFELWESNVFYLRKEHALTLFKAKKDDVGTKTYLKKLSQQLFSVC